MLHRMIFLFSLIRAINPAESDSVVVSNNGRMQNMNDLLKLGCNYYELNHVSSIANEDASADSQENIFANLEQLKERSEKRTLVFNGCDVSKSDNFILQSLYAAKDGIFDIDIVINNTDIGNGFKNILLINSLMFVDCTINLAALSGKGVVAANRVSFVNCRFVGEVTTKFAPILGFEYYSVPDDRVKNYKIEFTDCEFSLSENWKNSTFGNKVDEDPGKQFIVVKPKSGMTTIDSVNIMFRRCFYGKDGYKGSLRLIKSIATSDEEKSIISVTSEDSGISVDWCFVENENSMDYDPGVWENVVEDTGYYPVEKTDIPQEDTDSDSNNDDSSKDNKSNNSSKNEKTWRIVAIVFLVLFVVAVITLIVILVVGKKKFDRSENENN